MQEQTPVPKKRNKRKKAPRQNTRLNPNNPWQNVQPQSNNLPGFNFPGAVM